MEDKNLSPNNRIKMVSNHASQLVRSLLNMSHIHTRYIFINLPIKRILTLPAPNSEISYEAIFLSSIIVVINIIAGDVDMNDSTFINNITFSEISGFYFDYE